jgi:SMI1-KNR4 cell-wall
MFCRVRNPDEFFAPDQDAFEPPLTDETLHRVEKLLGVKLPLGYTDLARLHNGGYLALQAHPVHSPTTWADDHVGVHSIAAIGLASQYSVGGALGSRFWVDEWGYPDLGVYFADCPSAGHDMLALDYRHGGEPSVVHVDQEWDYRITPVAPSFAAFVDGLCDEDAFTSG